MLSMETTKINFFQILYSQVDFTPASEFKVSPQDLGFEIDEDQLACELQDLVPLEFSGQITTEIDTQVFEGIYGWSILLRV
jgi:hypothetical protein